MGRGSSACPIEEHAAKPKRGGSAYLCFRNSRSSAFKAIVAPSRSLTKEERDKLEETIETEWADIVHDEDARG